MEINCLCWLLQWHLNILKKNGNIGNWVQINTLDNPGWYFQTTLAGTSLENKQFQDVEIERNEDDWIHAFLRKGSYESACGPLNLLETLQIFRNWVDPDQTIKLTEELDEEDNMEWIMKWYTGQCDGNWEHYSALCLVTTDAPGWSIRFSIGETELEQIDFTPLSIQRSGTDWIDCFVKNNGFEGRCSAQNLNEVLGIFRYWAEAAQEADTEQ